MSQRLLWKAKTTGAFSVNSALNDISSIPCECLSGNIRVIRSTTLTTRTLMPGTCFCSSHEAAQISMVGTSPAQASTTSGSPPPSLVANFHVDAPRAMLKSLVHVQPLKLRLLAAGDDIHVIAAAQAMVERR
jgi:hypothetical protein